MNKNATKKLQNKEKNKNDTTYDIIKTRNEGFHATFSK